MPIAGLIEKLSIIKGRPEESDFVTMTLGETQKEEQETLTKRYSVCVSSSLVLGHGTDVGTLRPPLLSAAKC